MPCHFTLSICVACFSLFGVVPLSAANDQPTFEDAATKLQAATLTVRIIPTAGETAPPTDAGKSSAPPKPSEKPSSAPSPEAAAKVTICTGISLGGGLVVTHADVSAAKIRLTLPGGGQMQAKVRVFDQYSGLALLDADRADLPGIKLAEVTPAVGAWILSAAAWGAEKPVVSLGILSAAERSLPGSTYPPLLQCDLRTTDTSSGAAVVNRQGELVGVVAASDSSHDQRGWIYAVPASHVQRLLRVRSEAKDEKLVVLARLRPIVGLRLVAGDQPETVVVQRVEKDGPADKAGIREGDQILRAEGVTIRSVYEAERPVLQKQPGDRFTLHIRHGDDVRSVDLTLGGGRELPVNFAQSRTFVRPSLDIQNLAPGQYIAKNAQGDVREVSLPPGAAADDKAKRQLTSEEQIKLLDKALDRYHSALESMQAELVRRDGEQARSAEQLKALSAEVESLKRQLEAAKVSK